MAVLADVERFLERVFERSTARLFRAHVQPVQLERRVERARERARTGSRGRTVVPGRYRVGVQPDDLRELADHAGGAEALASRLADAALTFARAHSYHLPGRPGVALVADPSLSKGQVEVDAVSDDGRRAAGISSQQAAVAVAAAAPPPVPVPAAAPPPVPVPAAVEPWTPNPIVDAIEPDRQVRSPAPAPTIEEAFPGVRGDGTQTLVFRRPAPTATRAVLRVWSSDGAERTIEVDGTPLSIGRSRDNGLALDDGKVSRHHGRLQARRGTLVYTDLGSTNGSRVNGIRVDETLPG